MSAIGGKADIASAAHMSAYNPKPTCRTASEVVHTSIVATLSNTDACNCVIAIAR